MDEQRQATNDPQQNTAPSGAEVQAELERQLRQFGVTMSDAVRHGFEGRGRELGDRAWGVGRSVADVVNYGVSEAERAVNQARNAFETDPSADASKTATRSGAAGSALDAFADLFKSKNSVQAASRKLFSTGLPMVIVGGVFAFGLLLSGAICLLVGRFGAEDMSEYLALNITGGSLAIAGGLFAWMTSAGAARIGASRRMNTYANLLQATGGEQGFSVQELSDVTQRPSKKLRVELRKWVRKGWLQVWLDEASDRVYFSAESYRAAHRVSPQQKATPEETSEQGTEASKENTASDHSMQTMRQFSAVLAQQKLLMQDELAAEELEQMRTTVEAICNWLEAHPESRPKVRRFEEYYIPTTLKLLHTYNDVQGQKGENAEAIRRDIGGILHTLNLAYENLYNKLLSDMALDVSGEIAALQSMLAGDGLTEGGLL